MVDLFLSLTRKPLDTSRTRFSLKKKKRLSCFILMRCLDFLTRESLNTRLWCNLTLKAFQIEPNLWISLSTQASTFHRLQSVDALRLVQFVLISWKDTLP